MVAAGPGSGNLARDALPRLSSGGYPDHPIALASRGYLRHQRGDLAGAAADLDRAIAVAPGYALALINRSRLRESTGDLRGAIAGGERALETLLPGSREAAILRETLEALRRQAGGSGGDERPQHSGVPFVSVLGERDPAASSVTETSRPVASLARAVAPRLASRLVSPPRPIDGGRECAASPSA